MTELYSFRKATPWALLSMVAYAFQHPLVEPLAAQNRDGFLGYFSVLLFAELVPLGCLIILISQPKLKKNITFLFSSLENAKRVIILALLGTLSGLIYVVSVANLPLVYLALILNTMPIYAFVIGAFMHGVVPPRNVIFTSLVCWTGIFLTAGNTFIDQSWVKIISIFLFASLIPVLFALKSFLFNSWFSSKSITVETCRLLAISAIDIPLIAFCAIAVHFVLGGGAFLPSGTSTQFSLFLLGTFSVTIVAPLALQRSLSWSKPDYWYPMMFFFAIPILVAGIEYISYSYGFVNNNEIGRSDLYGITAITIGLISHFLLNREKYEDEEIKNE